METQINPSVPQSMPPEEQAPAAPPAAAPKAKKTGIVMIVVSVVATAVIVGAGIFFWQSSLVKKVSLSYEQSIETLNQQVASLQDQMSQLQNDADNAAVKEQEFAEQIAELQNKLKETEFKLAILDLWGVKNVVRDDEFNGLFYYSNYFNDTNNIGVYDPNSDLSYQAEGTYNIPSSNSVIYSENLSGDNDFLLLDVSNGAVVFVEQASDMVMEDCYSPWLSSIPKYTLDRSSGEAVKVEYDIPEEKMAKEQASYDECAGLSAPLDVVELPVADDSVDLDVADGLITEDSNEENNS